MDNNTHKFPRGYLALKFNDQEPFCKILLAYACEWMKLKKCTNEQTMSDSWKVTHSQFRNHPTFTRQVYEGRKYNVFCPVKYLQNVRPNYGTQKNTMNLMQSPVCA